VEQTIAVRCALLPKRHVFRREFEQSGEQLMIAYANSFEDAISYIFFYETARQTVSIFLSPPTIDRCEG
jgi:hypothetical protein